MAYTKQSPQELEQNIIAFKRMLGEKTVLNLVPAQGMTQEQLKQCRHNSAAFDVRMAAVNTGADGLVDYSVQNIADAYKFLRDSGMLKFEVAPVIRKAQTLTDNRGRIVRDLRQEKKDAAERAAAEAQAPRRTLEDEARDAAKRIEVNRMIENGRDSINSYRAKYHSDTARFKEAANKVLNEAIEKSRTIPGIAEALTEIRAMERKFYRD
jgi:cell division septum initiation protein DivIVA